VRARTAVVLALALVAGLGTVAAADDYTDSAYAQHDADNYARARNGQLQTATTPTYPGDFAGAAADSMGRAAGKQLNDLRKGRVYGGLSGYVPVYGTTGDASIYFDLVPRRVQLLSRTGAKLQGHVWNGEAAGTRPGVVITPGSIQGSDQMYWWAAHALARAGYVVMTFDAQGQGQSETFGHEAGSFVPTADGVPFQQEQNFVDGTVDVLGFFLSTPEKPYVPTGWTPEQVAAARAAADGEQVDWVNPAAAHLDRSRLGLAGHSLGARAVTVVQQCSDRGTAWRTVEACAGRSFPIQAVVAWDGLNPGEDVVPVVPAMDQRADGYFLSPTFSPTAPDPADHLGPTTTWAKAGLDTWLSVVRAGTHLEWSITPYSGPNTGYGTALAAYYTTAWMDRFVKADPAARAKGHAALLQGPRGEAELPWSANHHSVRRLSAFSLRAPGSRTPLVVPDLRAWAGRSAVGDWAGANADTVGSPLR
jgi:hypothetical protein